MTTDTTTTTGLTIDAATRTHLEALKAHVARVLDDYATAPVPLQRSEWGYDRLEEIENCERELKRFGM